MKPVHFFADSELIVIGTHPEAADWDNPRGEIYGYAAHVYAEDAQGNRVRMLVTTTRCDYHYEKEALAVAERQAEALNRRLAGGKLPVRFDLWDQARPAYGSRAYVEYGAADDLEWERSQD